jgi:hypothetical protein
MCYVLIETRLLMSEGEMWKLLVVWATVALAILITYGPAMAEFSSR